MQQGRIDGFQLQSALAHQQRWGGRLGEAMVGLGFLTEPVLLSEVARQLGVEYLDLTGRWVTREIVKLVPEKLIRRRRIFPVALGTKKRSGPLVVATSEPQDLVALDEVAFATGMDVKPILASRRNLEALIARHLDEPTPGHVDGLEFPVDAEVPVVVAPVVPRRYFVH